MSGHGSQLVAVIICLLVLAITAVALRCYVRIRLTGGFGVDDTLSVASLVCLQPKVTCCSAHNLITRRKIMFGLGSACILVGVREGSFGHMWMSISPPTLVMGLKASTS
jgi:uncharacterized membrane protein